MAQDIVGSKLATYTDPSEPVGKGYGQNGYSGPSSIDANDPNVTAGMLPGADLAKAKADRKQIQTRTINAAQPATTFGTRKRDSSKGVGG